MVLLIEPPAESAANPQASAAWGGGGHSCQLSDHKVLSKRYGGMKTHCHSRLSYLLAMENLEMVEISCRHPRPASLSHPILPPRKASGELLWWVLSASTGDPALNR